MSDDTLVVAGLSARYLAEAAARAGWRVIALDLFGDSDTLRVSRRWHAIGGADPAVIDRDVLRQALSDVAREPGVFGWVAGSGFDGDPGLLDAGGTVLPRLGMATADIAALRDPRHFFSVLDRLGLLHPPVAWTRPSATAGWLHKRGGGTGGWHIGPAGGAVVLYPDSYFQRHQPGVPMSVLCLADGTGFRLVALNRQTVQARSSAHPHVFVGVRGPVIAPVLQTRVESALARLVPAFGLRGLLSVDFIDVGGEPCWLEVNPRPSASMQLQADAWPGGLLAAHCAALNGHLPDTPACLAPGRRGVETLWAASPCRVDAALAEQLAAEPAVHDLPQAGAHFEPGQPVCSVSAEAVDDAALAKALAGRLDAVRRRLRPVASNRIPEETVP